ncbi:MAG: ATP-dependent zinc metalloprotease FtsH [Clostridia bacterium]|nr:ATP-dependent zinc metalloprotease FtsH [Clostridia bacterium]
MAEIQQKPRIPWLWMLLLAALVVVMIITFGSAGNSKEIEWSVFTTHAEAGEMSDVYAVGGTIYGRYTAEAVDSEGKKLSSLTENERKQSVTKKYDFTTTYVSSEYLMNYIDQVNADLVAAGKTKINAEFKIQTESIWARILPYVGMALLMGLFLWLAYRMFSNMSGKNNEFGKNKARVDIGLKVRFSDVAGCDEEKREVQELVEFLKNPKKFTDLGARIPKGVLLVGKPGTGKTLLAKAIAGEAGVPFFSITGSDFVEMFVGVGAARVRDLFETAKKQKPCIIFIDEIDAVGRHRGTGIGNTNDEREQTLNQLLVQMDGFESSEGIIVLAATNRPDVLDPALLRAGRFDRQIVVNPPDVRGREKILKLYAKDKPMAENINFAEIAKMLPGETGADIENIINEAAILAARDNRAVITQSDIMEGISKVQMGPQKRSAVMTPEQQKCTAYHESGHAIVSKSVTEFEQNVQEIIIIRRGMAGGYTAHTPKEDITQLTKEQVLDHICIAMGGRAAELIKYGKLSTGASNDIKVATDMARSMVTEWGMSEKLGPVYYSGEQEMFLGRDFQSQRNYSDDTARVIDDEVRDILQSQLQRAVNILKSKDNILENMTEVLLQKETIYSADVEALMEGKSVEEVVKSIDERQAVLDAQDQQAREEKTKRDEEEKAKAIQKAQQLREQAILAYELNIDPKDMPNAQKAEEQKQTNNQLSNETPQPPQEVKQDDKKQNNEEQK